MPTHSGGASRPAAISRSFVFFVVIACSSGLAAQNIHPFAPPVTNPTFNLGSVVGLLDANRDGSKDLLVPGLFFGTMLTTLDEHGAALVANGAGPGLTMAPGVPTSPTGLAMAGGTIDGDALEDLITVTSAGTIHFHRNLGSTRPDRASFAPDVIVDNLLAAYPINPPFISYSFPTVEIVDFDHDGHNDFVLAGGPVDRWSAATRPGFVGLYRGNGAGGFQPIVLPLSGCTIDCEVVDLDQNGSLDHIIVLTETGSMGAYYHEIVHFAWNGTTLVMVGAPQNVGPGRLMALELADVIGDPSLDYVLAQTAASAGTTTAQVFYFQGNGLGAVSGSQWGTLSLPTNLTGVSDYIVSIQAGDFNRDGHVDIAILRGFVQPPPPLSSAVPLVAAAEVLVASGPNVAWSTLETIPLPGYHMFAATSSSHFALLPVVTAPDALRPIDLGGDNSIDFVVTCLRTLTSPSTMFAATLRNQTQPQFGDARFEKVGNPSGGVAARPARIGFDGGRPRAGNSAFACTLQNVQGGCLVGLVWGPIGMANAFVDHGVVANLLPSHLGYGELAGGTGPGDGFHSHALPIPPMPAIVGDAGYFQYVYYDHVSGTFGGTQATGLWIGN